MTWITNFKKVIARNEMTKQSQNVLFFEIATQIKNLLAMTGLILL